MEQEKEMKVAVETPEGRTVWLKASQVAAWKQGQAKLKAGEEEAVKEKERLKSELLSKFNDL